MRFVYIAGLGAILLVTLWISFYRLIYLSEVEVVVSIVSIALIFFAALYGFSVTKSYATLLIGACVIQLIPPHIMLPSIAAMFPPDEFSVVSGLGGLVTEFLMYSLLLLGAGLCVQRLRPL